ncbi:MAG: flagellar assembly protein FliW [Planctomycetota bacterium]
MFCPILASQASGPRAVQTFNVGTLQVPPTSIVQLVEPLLGLGTDLEFLVYRTGPGAMSWWQSVANLQLALCCLEPFAAGLDPDMSIDQAAAEAIGASGPDDIIVFTVVVLDRDPTQIRTNLRAPILVSRSTGKGVQIILDDAEIPVKAYLTELVAKKSKV